MQKSTIPFLLINFFLVLVLSSCASNVVKGYTPVPLEKKTVEIPYFSNSKMDYVYKANISVYGNELTGIFIAKKINETTHRVVFTTEFGNKLLDFEISENDFKVNSIAEELNRKILINTLKEDFRLLLRKNYLIETQFENATDKVYQSREGNKYNYLFVSKANEKQYKIVHSSRTKEKISISFDSENNIFAERVIIQHKNIKLKIELNYLQAESN
jgi:phosphoribosylformylglycinamidine (FGAM) synthase PurS component